MKKLLLLFLLIGSGLFVHAAHLKGGWIKYEYLGDGSNPNTSKYRVTVRQYLDTVAMAGQIDAFVSLSVFDGLTNQIYQTFNINSTSFGTVRKEFYDPCVSPNPPNPLVKYRIDEYVATIDLPNNINGYTLSVQRCCRIDNIANVVSAGNNTGITYMARIPGVMNGIDYSKNSNPDFIMRDTVLLCYNAPFTFSFSATDADGDSLSYMFCEGVNTPTADPKPAQSSNPPFPSVTYNPGYTGSTPLGNKVSIDPVTGIISGIAPGTVGTYVVSVCVNEYRNGVLFNTNRKEIHVNVANCSLAGASLKPSYITCDGFTLNFENESASSSIASYLWTFGETGVATSSNPTPTHTYKDTGTYTLKLKVTSTGGCQDSTTALVRVYPGFTPDFTVQGTCYINSYRFLDATTTRYGVVDSWRWDLGDLSTNADTARSKDTAWKYSTPQSVQVRLIATNSKGCIDTVVKTVSILDKPIVNLAFKDTLICSIDTLALRATINNGTILWEPQLGRNSSRIINPNSTNPLVYPLDTTRYIVTVNDNGCQNKDTVTVNVLNFIKVELGPDTAICLTDQFNLRPISDALSYQWTASTGVPIASNSKYPLVQPLVNTKYYVIANLGKCQDRDSVAVRVVPYPYAVVMPDTAICFGERIQLAGNIVGSSFSWSPSNALLGSNTLFPMAGPSKTTQYILSATDTLGCPKPYSDTVTVYVVPPIKAYAGRDTVVTANQPIQLQGSGGTRFQWRPATGLDNPNTENPVAVLGSDIDSIRYILRVSDVNGCYAEDDVVIRVFKNGPDLYVPSGFTPNGDGKNDVLRPVAVGITQLISFRVFNRWGQLMFETNQFGKGWDGTYNGVKQASGTYVFEAVGTDISGKQVYRKGTAVLIR